MDDLDVGCGTVTAGLGVATAPRPTDAVRVLFGEAVAVLARGDADGAFRRLERAAALAPDQPEIRAELAAAALQLGRAEDARREASEALRLGLDDARLRTVLGLAYRDLGRPDEALAQFERAVAIGPDQAAAHLNLGDAYARAGRDDQALPRYEEAARLDPTLLPVFLRLGAAYTRAERLREAFAAYAAATRLDPRRIDAWRGMASLQAAVEDHGQAIGSWERILALSPTPSAADLRGLAWSLQEEHRLDESEARFRQALAVDPDSPDLRVDLAFLLQERGEMDEAEALLRCAIGLQPGHVLANARLASLRRKELPAADLDSACALAARSRPDTPALCALHYGLGQAFDARGDYEEAARHLARANALHLGQIRPHQRFSTEAHARFHDDLIRTFDRAFFGRVAGAGRSTRRPVFVVGLPRSGTSLVEQILASHPEVHGAGELPLARRMYFFLPTALGQAVSPAEAAAKLAPEAFGRLADAYLERLDEKVGAGRARVVDKMPDNVMFLGLLTALFPDARVIHCRRDLRDIALSCWMADFRSLFWTNDPAHIAERFRNYLRLDAHWREALPTPVVDVHYEELVEDLEGNARRLVAAMGLDWHPACLDFHRTRRAVQTSSATQVRQPIHRRSVGRWRNYAPFLPELFSALPEAP